MPHVTGQAAPESSRPPILEVSGLSRRFEERFALRDVSFSVPEGEIFAFIGPNGAGKTTTIRILATLLEPTRGEVRVAGHCVRDETEEVRRLIGYLPDRFGVYEGLTVREYLEFFAAAYRLSGQRRQRVLGDVLELTDLAPLARRMVRSLSLGMRQRLCLARTLVHDPRLLILDEPASSLDPRARIEFRMLLRELRDMGKTIFISSHILTELSDVCTSVGIIEKGRLVACGSVAELTGPGTRTRRVEIGLHSPHAGAVEVLRARDDVRDPVQTRGRLEFDYLGPDEDFWRVIRALTDREVSVLSVSWRRSDLERLFLDLTKGDVQ